MLESKVSAPSIAEEDTPADTHRRFETQPSPAERKEAHVASADEPVDAPSALESVDWSFAARVSHTPLEALHPYPAKFVADLPRALIERLRPPSGTLVLDPFCGSGTTLAESQRLGIPCVGIDLNPIACLIARVRTGPPAEDAAREAARIVEVARELCVTTPEIPNLDHWFDREVQSALAKLVGQIEDIPPGPLCDLLKLALSSIVVRVSRQDSDTRYAAVDKDVSAADVFAAFTKASARIQAALETREYPLTKVDVVEADTLAFDASRLRGKVGLVVTSPPYPNAYEYWLYHKYRMFWLGWDPIAVKDAEIGARAHFFRKNHHTAEDFGRQMGGVLDLIHASLIDGGHACFVVGRSRIHGRIVDNAAMIEKEAADRGFVSVFATERTIASKRKSFNLAHANIKTETVLVLRKAP